MTRVFSSLFFLGVFLSVIWCVSAPSVVSASGEQLESAQTMRSRIVSHLERWYLWLPGKKASTVVLHQALLAQQRGDVPPQTLTSRITFDAHVKEKSAVSVAATITSSPLSDGTSQVHAEVEGTALGQRAVSVVDLWITAKKVWVRFLRLPDTELIRSLNMDQTWWWLETSQSTSSPDWSPSQRQHLALATTQLIQRSTLSAAEKETKNDVPVFVMHINIPKTAALEYFMQLYTIQTDGAYVTLVDPRPAMDAVLTRLGEIELTIWVDRSNYSIRRVEFPFLYTPPNGVPVSQVFGTVATDFSDATTPVFSPPTQEGKSLLPVLTKLQSVGSGGVIK